MDKFSKLDVGLVILQASFFLWSLLLVVIKQLLFLFLWQQAPFVVVTFRLAKGCNFAWGPPSL